MPYPTDETRFWRNLAMERGHEKLDPDYIANAIKDIYENDFSDGDRTPCTQQPVAPAVPRSPCTNALSRAHTPVYNSSSLPQPQCRDRPPRQQQPRIYSPQQFAIFGNDRHRPYASSHHRRRRGSVNLGVGIDPGMHAATV